MTRRVVLPLLLWALAFPAHAALITWEYEGVVQEIDASEPVLAWLSSLGVVEGATTRGSHRFESDTPNITTSGRFGRYVTAIDRQSLSIGSLVVDLEIAPPFGISDIFVRGVEAPFGTFTQVFWVTQSTGSVLERASFGLSLISNDPAVAFGSNALLLDPPPLSLFPSYDPGNVEIYFRGTTAAGTFTIHSSVTSVVPEPEIPTLLGVGALALYALRRRATS